MRQQDIEMFIRAKGYERGIRECLIRIVEEVNDMKGTMNEMVDAISSMATVITTLNVVADGMKNKIDRMAHRDDDVRSTRTIAEGD